MESMLTYSSILEAKDEFSSFAFCQFQQTHQHSSRIHQASSNKHSRKTHTLDFYEPPKSRKLPIEPSTLRTVALEVFILV
jgi:hypothetical protein